MTCLIWNKLSPFTSPQHIGSSIPKQEMGECQGCEKIGRMVSGYQNSLILSPVISFWECIVRKSAVFVQTRAGVGVKILILSLFSF